jgi:translation initiation factor IF-2
MAKIRVYELARELGKDNKEVVEILQGLNLESTIKGVQSTVTEEEAQRVRRALRGDTQDDASRARQPAVIRRRSTGGRNEDEDERPAEPTPAPVVVRRPVVRPSPPMTP